MTNPPATPAAPLVPPAWAVEAAAQVWCSPSCKSIPMDTALAEEFARTLAQHAPAHPDGLAERVNPFGDPTPTQQFHDWMHSHGLESHPKGTLDRIDQLTSDLADEKAVNAGLAKSMLDLERDLEAAKREVERLKEQYGRSIQDEIRSREREHTLKAKLDTAEKELARYRTALLRADDLILTAKNSYEVSSLEDRYLKATRDAADRFGCAVVPLVSKLPPTDRQALRERVEREARMFMDECNEAYQYNGVISWGAFADRILQLLDTASTDGAAK